MPGPKKQYPIQLAIRLSAEGAAMLDKLRGDKTRSQWIRDMIRYASAESRQST